jgi:hypothetical protein
MEVPIKLVLPLIPGTGPRIRGVNIDVPK